MNIAKIVSPINLPSTQSTIRVNYQVSTQLPEVPQPQPNPYNSRSDGFITTTLFGGISGKNFGKAVFQDNPELVESLNRTTVLQKTGVNMGVGAAIYGSLSLLKQGIGMASGKQDAAGAMANITTDILRGGGAGLGATAGGGLTGLAMKAIGATGTAGVVVSFIGGMIGASIGGRLVEATGIRETLVDKFGSKKAMI